MSRFANLKRGIALAGAAVALAGGVGLTTAASASADAGNNWACSENPSNWDHMNWGNCLLPGDQMVSADGAYRLVYQSDGNLVEYDQWGSALWSTSTQGHAPGKAIMQNDGNFVVYDTFQNAVWSSSTNFNCNPSANWLRLQDDANLVVYRPHGSGAWTPVWSTHGGMVGSC
ncbi:MULTISPECIES: hypothetical protein [Kitasatospora]|uniref:hypothetical protein n=1 Tax=Kitasatospora TaxID=2063 RepID=UPI000C71297E|nr:hypothetical protein [Kitasatospora sp. GP30]MDH6145443.1 hypothetical protein [Kitasatospora sp. GP30]